MARIHGPDEPVAARDAEPAAAASPTADLLIQLQTSVGNRAVARAVAGTSDQVEHTGLSALIARQAGRGNPLTPAVRAEMEERFDADFGSVRIHRDAPAADVADRLGARALTIGQDVFFQADAYDPDTRKGYATLAHELTHTIQQGVSPGPASASAGPLSISQPSDPAERAATRAADRLVVDRDRPADAVLNVGNVTGGLVQRETAHDIVDRHTTLGAFVDSSAIANELVPLLRARQYAMVADAVRESNRSAVVNGMLGQLPPLELITLAANPAARPALNAMADEIGEAFSVDDTTKSNTTLLQAVLGNAPAREAWNRARIRQMQSSSGTHLAALTAMFDDDRIVDDGTLASRLSAVLASTEHLVIPGLQTGIDFGDTGFAGDQRPGGSGFRDPWPSSRNQVGHFLTAVGLKFSPAVVSRQLPYFGSIRTMVDAPASMRDQDVALRLTIGHEKAPDPTGTIGAFAAIVFNGFIEGLLPGPEGETDDERDARIARAVEAEIQLQVGQIISAFRRQFMAVNDHDLDAWNRALAQLGPQADPSALEGVQSPLNDIQVGTGRGNSIQDLRLSLVGWQFGQMIGAGQFPDRHSAAAWLRAHLGPATPP